MNAVQTSRRNSSYRRKKDPNYKLTALIGVILLVVILCAALALYGRGKTASTEESSTEAPETEMIQEVTVDGVTITGMSKSEAREAILAEFPWAMTVAFEDDVYEVEDLMAWKVDALLDEIYSGTPKASYTLDTDGMEEEAAQAAQACASRWDKAAKNGSKRARSAAATRRSSVSSFRSWASSPLRKRNLPKRRKSPRPKATRSNFAFPFRKARPCAGFSLGVLTTPARLPTATLWSP